MVPRTALSGWTARFARLADTGPDHGVASSRRRASRTRAPARSDRPVNRPPRQHRRRLRRFLAGVLILTVVGGTIGAFAVATDTLGAGERWESVLMRVDRFLAGPVPDRATLGTVRVT